MRKFFWVITILGTILAIIAATFSLLYPGSVMQNIEGFAIALSFAIIPYILARSVSEISKESEINKD